MLRELFGFFRSESKEPKNDFNLAEKIGGRVPDIKDDQPRNPYTEIKILAGHSDHVHLMTSIDETRALTAAQDNTVAIWNIVTGNLIFKLYGHTKPINCVQLFDYHVPVDLVNDGLAVGTAKVLLTASFDRSIRLWSLDYGNCLKNITVHDYAVKCFLKLRDDDDDTLYCSGGDHISLWDQNLTLLHTYRRKSLNFIQSLLSIKDQKIVAATDKPYLAVYCIVKSGDQVELQQSTRLPTHREPITCLINISDAMFASASLDGMIMVWTTYHLQPARKFNCHEQYKHTIKNSFMYNVKHLFALEQKYLFAAIGSGFYIFDTLSDRCLVKQSNAHHEDINHMALVGDGSILATCSVDGTTRLWGHPSPVSSDEVTEQNLATTPLERIVGKRAKFLQRTTTTLELIGECAGHSDSVQLVVSCGAEGFLTCGLGDMVILWKNGELQMERKNKLIKDIIREKDLFGF